MAMLTTLGVTPLSRGARLGTDWLSLIATGICASVGVANAKPAATKAAETNFGILLIVLTVVLAAYGGAFEWPAILRNFT